jgi:hypothetical protein
MGRASRLKRERRELGDFSLPASGFEKFGRSLLKLAQEQQDPPPIKMSQALLELVEPFMDEIEDLDEFTNLVGLATLGWSLSLLDDRTAKQAIRDLREIYSPDSDFLQWIVVGLADRKRLLFPDDDRAIQNWETSIGPDGRYHLQVASLTYE